jgi:outer membrane lipoprotein-sorting protein
MSHSLNLLKRPGHPQGDVPILTARVEDRDIPLRVSWPLVAKIRGSSYTFALLACLALLLAACGGSHKPPINTPAPTPTLSAGQQLLETTNRLLSKATTLHGIFTITGSGSQFSGTARSEIWNAQPNKSRTAVLSSTIAQLPGGEVIVSNGKQQWQYDPSQKVVYTGPASSSSDQSVSSVSILDLVRSAFTTDNATLVSSSASVDGQSADEVHVVVNGLRVSGITGLISYTGDVYIDTATHLPLRMALHILVYGQVQIDIASLALNQPIAASTFTFTVPRGVKVLPLQQAPSGGNSGSLTLAQAEQQAGYHLLSIPASQSSYVLQGITALGAPGNQVYTLSYTSGKLSFTIAEGKPLANLPASGGQSVSLRGTTANLTTSDGSTTLTWTEKSIGITITGAGLSSTQVEEIARLLS